MTHAPPNDKELASLNKWMDRHVKTSYLQHRHRIGDLLNTQMIARSVVEHLFLCRVLSMFAQTKVLQEYTGTSLDSVLHTDSLNITHGIIARGCFVGITADHGRRVILRGDCANTYAEAMMLFIDTVLDTSTMYQIELLKQMEDSCELETRAAEDSGR
ncbi:hypothetical protein EKO04_001816 [Ascochyta lentis]|uniref:Uncharacterized protein n=1 Tax=Ascochyta lentis TaxID=205686 RepID=A0A8H7MLX3_9PLEO|nr:hypothetical protein EKO04_001816 [Ascochyta lentis]